MSDYKSETPPRPEGWRYSKVESKKINYSDLWKSFSEQFRSQQTRDITGRSGSYSPKLEQIELEETKQDEI